MTEQNPTSADDVEGHLLKSGRLLKAGRYADVDQADDDAEGHVFRRTFTEGDRDDLVGDNDVAGHLSGALGAQQRDEGH